MYVDNVSLLNNITFKPDLVKVDNAQKNSSFEDIYQAALSVLDETNKYQFEAEQAQLDLATGKTDNILTVLLAQEKAYSSLNFTVQVTNKIIESYREIMRMQV